MMRDLLLHLAKVFPPYHLAQGLLDGFDPHGPAAGFSWATSPWRPPGA